MDEGRHHIVLKLSVVLEAFGVAKQQGQLTRDVFQIMPDKGEAPADPLKVLGV